MSNLDIIILLFLNDIKNGKKNDSNRQKSPILKLKRIILKIENYDKESKFKLLWEFAYFLTSRMTFNKNQL